MDEIIHLNTIDDYNRMMGLETLHPLVTVVDLKNAKKRINNVKLNYGVYALFLKRGEGCKIYYGRQLYDYQAGTIVSFAPGQLIKVEMNDDVPMDAIGLLFHPDLIYGTSLGSKMQHYSFFEYAQNEALHLSDQERGIITDCFKRLEQELSYPVDKHSRQIICVQIEMILDYCLRFYDRQFVTRRKANSSVVNRFENLLNDYFSSRKSRTEGLPSVKYFADQVCLSPGYFGDLIKRETGCTAQEFIQRKIIDISKNQLISTEQSVSEIAYMMGFQYPQHFIRLFKREVGCTPREFRTAT